MIIKMKYQLGKSNDYQSKVVYQALLSDAANLYSYANIYLAAT